MVVFEHDEDNICEGCMVRNTGENFSHPGFCKGCMSSMMEAPTEEVLEGNNTLTDRFAKHADEKVGPLTSWRDTDGIEVEIMLPLPPGVTKQDLRVKCSTTKLLVAMEERKLLFVDPLYDEVVPDELVWCIETGKDGGKVVQISLAKKHPGTRWHKTLSQEGGQFECWKSQLLEEKDGEGSGAAGAPGAAAAIHAVEKKKPRFTMRDDGGEVEVFLPLPSGMGIHSKKALQVKCTTRTLQVHADGKELLKVDPLYEKVVPDELQWTLEKAKDSDQVHCVITLAKLDDSVQWESNLVGKDGTFTCWTTDLDAKPKKR